MLQMAIKLAKEHTHRLSPIWANAPERKDKVRRILFGGLDVAKLAPCIAAGLGIARQPLVRIPPPHRPALRLVKG